MNVVINILTNSIVITSQDSKKKGTLFNEFSFPYSLRINANKVKALAEVLGKEEIKAYGEDKTISLVVPDDQIFIGLISLPLFGTRKMRDTFETTFKISYPDFQDYYIEYDKYSKNDSNTTVLYKMCRVNLIDEIKKILTPHGFELKNIDFFSHHIFEAAKNQNRIITKLIVGEKESEFIIYNDSTPVCHSILEIGKEVLDGNKEYLQSSYNIDNELALKYASFHKVHFDSKNLLTDDIVRSNEIHESFVSVKPKELRLLKDASLENYLIKQIFLRIHSFVMDNISFYKEEPYFFPVNTIEVICDDNVFEGLQAANVTKEITYQKSSDSLASLYSKDIANNSLFSNRLTVKERRRIDWAKLLSMEIGKKKKA